MQGERGASGERNDMKKEFGLHFRYRDDRNELFDVGMVCLARSQKEAKAFGKSQEREKVWFKGLISPESAIATGGNLP